jgi:hypothetical protein
MTSSRAMSHPSSHNRAAGPAIASPHDAHDAVMCALRKPAPSDLPSDYDPRFRPTERDGLGLS